MRTATLSAAQVFEAGQFEVPFFQRVYLWNRGANGKRLLEAILDRATIRVEGRPSSALPLGWIVLDTTSAESSPGIYARIVDGQHRLTNLQLALAAARDLALEFGCIECTALFQKLIQDHFGRLRLRSNRADDAMFHSVMHAGGAKQIERLALSDRNNGITTAYLYFHGELRQWLATSPPTRSVALLALYSAFCADVRLFVFDLERNLMWRAIYRAFSYVLWPQHCRAARRESMESWKR